MLDRDLVLPHLLARQAERRGDSVFVDVVGGDAVTYRDYHTEALRWAAALAATGVEPGRQVASMIPVSLDGTLNWIATAWLRARTVPINVAHRGRMLHYVLHHSGATHLVIAQRYLPRLAELEGELPELTTVIVCDADEPEVDIPQRVIGRHELLHGVTPDEREGPEQHDIAGVFYTSGTTGPSKGVLVPWAQLHATATANAGQLNDQDAWYSPMPLSHVSGTSPFYGMALAGGRIVLRESFSTGDFLDDVEKHRCTAALVLGAIAQFLMSLPPSESDRDTPLRYVGMSPVQPFVDEFKERFGVVVFSGYNMTELSMPICWPGATVNGDDHASLGKVRSGYEVRLVDAHDQDVPDGTIGELIVRSDEPWTLNAGYLGMPEATAAAWRNGWFHTGDALTRDERGNFYFVDRMKDTIRRRGENISSAEVEIEVVAHPAVLEAAVVAAPSELGEDEVKVFVVVRPDHTLTPQELVEFLVPRMAHYMVPRFVEFVDDLPKTNTFKVQKHELRARPNGDATWDRQAAGIVVKRDG